MILLNRIKTLRAFKKVIKQTKKGKFDAIDVQVLLNYLIELKDTDSITNDYFESVYVLFYVTNKCLSVDSTQGVTLSKKDLSDPNAYRKMSDLIKELEANSFIHYKSVDLRGIIGFKLTYKDDLNKYLIKKINDKRDALKIVKHNGFVAETINFLCEQTREISISVIGLIILKLLFS